MCHIPQQPNKERECSVKELSFFRTNSPSSVRSNMDSLRQLHNKTKARVKDNLPSSIYGLLVLEGVEASAAAVAEAVAVGVAVAVAVGVAW